MPFNLNTILRRFGWLEYSFLLAVAAFLAAGHTTLGSGTELLLRFVALVLAIWVAFRWRKAFIWRLRYRLLVTYLFIAVVPILLIAALVEQGSELFTGQLTAYLVTSELDRQTSDLLDPARGLAWTPPNMRTDRAQWIVPALWHRFSGLEILIRDDSVWRFPQNAAIEPPPSGWGDVSGLVRKKGRLYFWAHAIHDSTEVVMMAPVTQQTLDHLLPIPGDLSLMRPGMHIEKIPGGGAP
jgi:hypothetical protein